MKNYIILLMLLCFVSANAQETEPAEQTSKSGAERLPVAGDIAIGADALPYLNYLGNMLSSAGNNTLALGSNTLYFRYFLTDNSAVRANIKIVSTKNILRQYIQDDAAVLADPLSQAKVEDKMTTSANGYNLNIGYFMTKGHGRLLGFYGAQIGYGRNRTIQTYQYGNDITVANNIPTIYDWTTSASTRKAVRTLENDATGLVQNLGAGIFAGAEYYFLPKICIGGEVGISYFYQWGTQSNSKTEEMQGTKIVEMDVVNSPGNIFSGITTNRPATYGGLYLMFHF